MVKCSAVKCNVLFLVYWLHSAGFDSREGILPHVVGRCMIFLPNELLYIGLSPGFAYIYSFLNVLPPALSWKSTWQCWRLAILTPLCVLKTTGFLQQPQ